MSEKSELMQNVAEIEYTNAHLGALEAQRRQHKQEVYELNDSLIVYCHAGLCLVFRFHVQGCIFLNIFHMLRLVLVGLVLGQLSLSRFLTSNQRPTFCLPMLWH